MSTVDWKNARANARAIARVARRRQRLVKRLALLRHEHTQLFAAEKYAEMHTVGDKIKHQLDAIVRTFPDWKENDEEARQFILNRGKE